MTTYIYRVESSHPIIGPFSPSSDCTSFLFEDRALAIVIAAKSITRPRGQEIRVVYLPTEQVIYRKTATVPATTSDDSARYSPAWT